MKAYKYPAKEEWKEILERPPVDSPSIEKKSKEDLGESKD
jgi:hypothetical protein